VEFSGKTGLEESDSVKHEGNLCAYFPQGVSKERELNIAEERRKGMPYKPQGYNSSFGVRECFHRNMIKGGILIFILQEAVVRPTGNWGYFTSATLWLLFAEQAKWAVASEWI